MLGLVCTALLALVKPDARAAPAGLPLIAFEHKVYKAAQAIYVMSADGSDQRLLATGTGFAWSPDGDRIAFQRRSTSRVFDELWVIGRDGRDLRRVATGAFGRPTWSPDGGRLAFVGRGNTAPRTTVIHVVDSDGSDRQQLPGASGDWDYRALSWSPDGTQIAFVQDKFGQNLPGGAAFTRVGTVKPDGRDWRILHRGFLTGASAIAWSPNSSEVAFVASQAPKNRSDLYVMSRLGTKRRNLTRTPATSEADPSWSPDGRMIVFVRELGLAKSGVHVIRRDGIGDVTLDSPKTNGVEPSWSPDGRNIVFVSRRDGNQDIYAVTATGRNQTNLTSDRLPTQNTSPEWAPR